MVRPVWKFFSPLLWLSLTAPVFAGDSSYFFNGKDFQPGINPGTVTVVATDGFLPGLSKGGVLPKPLKLADGNGGLLLLCYVQTSGGKLKSASGYTSVAGAPVEIDGGGLKLQLRADGDGYAMAALPAGSYQIRVLGFSRTIRIERGKNVLAAIRSGKRMVD